MKKINLKIIWKKTKHSFSNIGSDADKDWRIVLSLFIIFIFVSVIWHINVYIDIGGNDSLSLSEKTSDKTEVNAAILAQMIEKYDKRAEEFQSIKTNKKVLIDPAQ